MHALLRACRDAQVFAIVPPAVQELGNATGFDLELEDRGNLGHAGLIAGAQPASGPGGARSACWLGVRPNSLDDTPQLHVDIDQAKAGALGVSLADINSTLSAAWGGTFINDFIDRGRVKRVYMQGDAPYRMTPEDLDRWYVRSATGTMAPFSSFAIVDLDHRPGVADPLQRPARHRNAGPGPARRHHRHGDAGDGQAGRSKLPKASAIERTGLSYQEEASGAQAPALYGLSILVVFLCLAALYESWAIPLSVMLVIPLGVVGASGADQPARACSTTSISRSACSPPSACRPRTPS